MYLNGAGSELITLGELSGDDKNMSLCDDAMTKKLNFFFPMKLKYDSNKRK